MILPPPEPENPRDRLRQIFAMARNGTLPAQDYAEVMQVLVAAGNQELADALAQAHASALVERSVLNKKFAMARNGSLSAQDYAEIMGVLLDAGHPGLADALAKTYAGGLEFVAAVHAAMQQEHAQENDAAMRNWERAAVLNPGNGWVFTRRGLLGLRMVFGNRPPPRSALANRQCVTSLKLGTYGRFSNQLIQYGFLKVYATRYDLDVQTPDWIGRYLFDLDDPLPSRAFKTVEEQTVDLYSLLGDKSVEPLVDVDFTGYFLCHTRLLAPYRETWRACFTLGSTVKPTIDAALARLRQLSPEATVVALHIRRGDYGSNRFRIAPVDWYLEWLSGLWETLKNPILYVASDDPSIVNEFARYRPIKDATIAPTPIKGAEFLVDFEVLRHADVVAVSDSTFSLAACMLSETKGGRFFRPHFVTHRLVPFDPWNSTMLTPVGNPGDGPAINIPLTTAEQWIIEHLLRQKSTVFAVGVRSDQWVKAVMNANAENKIHVLVDFPDYVARVSLLDAARPSPREAPQAREQFDNMDSYCRSTGVRHIQLLDIGAEADAVRILNSAQRMLKHARIDIVVVTAESGQFSHLYRLLTGHGFSLFAVRGSQLINLPQPENLLVGDLCVAIHQRLVPLLFGHDKKMIDLSSALQRYGIVPKGVVHVGAHEGRELGNYQAMGARPVVFIEANPVVFARLVALVGDQPDVVTIQRAVSDQTGSISLHLMSKSMSSSILAPAMHNTLYPSITEVGVVEVETSPLDDLLSEFYLEPDHYNLLSVDIQGAELVALRGACGLLRHIEAVNVEVNFDELYVGCAQIEDLDDFLEAHGFVRVMTTCPWHASWGDALYIRNERVGYVTCAKA